MAKELCLSASVPILNGAQRATVLVLFLLTTVAVTVRGVPVHNHNGDSGLKLVAAFPAVSVHDDVESG